MQSDATVKAVVYYAIEVEKNGRVYTFTMPVGSPLGDAFDASFKVLESVGELQKQAIEKAKEGINVSSEQEAPVELAR